MLIPTLDGEMMCQLGDYLIKEPFPTDWRKIYPCKQIIFEQTYERELPLPSYKGESAEEKFQGADGTLMSERVREIRNAFYSACNRVYNVDQIDEMLEEYREFFANQRNLQQVSAAWDAAVQYTEWMQPKILAETTPCPPDKETYLKSIQ